MPKLRPLSIELREDSLSTAPESVCHACTSRPRPILCVSRSGTVARRLLLRRRYHARRSEHSAYHVVTEAAASPGHTKSRERCGHTGAARMLRQQQDRRLHYSMGGAGIGSSATGMDTVWTVDSRLRKNIVDSPQ